MASPSQLIGHRLGHYRILEQIGAGGMGVVYLAHDEQLDRDVAIKVLPAGMLADDASRKRFRHEALSLAKLNHPNIATVHEFGDQGGTDFLVTEFIAGITLEGKLTAGALPTEQVLYLGVQLAQGLTAAHEHGIVHRDLKPANLRLTTDERLKILDFGLAQLAPHPSELGLTATSTQTQDFSGTLPYMSPEQLRGDIADTRSDIWAVGVVLYEMATAHRPFEQRVPTALAADIIHAAPPPPRKLRSDLPPGLEAVILKCLEKDPARRYQSARELQSDLERLSTDAGSLIVRSRWSQWAVTGVLALLLGAAVVWYLVAHRREAGSSSFKGRRSVAVLGFKNVSGRPEEAWISTALSEMLTTELAAGQRLRTVPGEDVARTKIDLSLPDTDSYGRDTLTRIRKSLGTDFVVLGSYFDAGTEAGGQVRLDLWLQDAQAGETVAAVSETGTEARLLDLVSRAGSALRAKLGVGDVTAAEAGAVRASVPSDPEAARLYAEGLKKLREFDALGARDLLEKAVVADPSYPLAHSTLAEVWSRLGYDQKAKEEARKAFDLSAGLSPDDRLLVEARYRAAIHERDKAVELYRQLFNSFPDNLDYGLRLATTQSRAGKAKDAMLTVAALRKLAPPASDDPRIDLAEADAEEALGDFKPAQAAARRSAEKAEALGTPLLAASAQLSQCRISRNLGQYEDSRAACGKAEVIYTRTGNRAQAATALLALGSTLYEQGDLAAAQQATEQALAGFRQVGRESGIASSLSEIANLLSLRGDHLGALTRYKQALDTYREIEDKSNFGAELHNVAGQLSVLGDLPEATSEFRKSLEANREFSQEDVVAMDLANLGSVLFLRGDLPESGRVLEQALAICHRIDFKQACGVALTSQGDLLSGQGKLDQASGKYDEALKIRNEMGAQLDAAETQVSIADLAIETGHAKDAEAAVRQAREIFRTQKLIEDEIWADSVLARALLAQGKAADALKELDSATPRAEKIQNEEVQLKLALAAASVRAASGKPADQAAAGNRLQSVIAQAKKHDFLRYQFEARLALGQIEMKSGNGRARLAELEKDARAKGFLLIARKAAAAAKS